MPAMSACTYVCVHPLRDHTHITSTREPNFDYRQMPNIQLTTKFCANCRIPEYYVPTASGQLYSVWAEYSVLDIPQNILAEIGFGSITNARIKFRFLHPLVCIRQLTYIMKFTQPWSLCLLFGESPPPTPHHQGRRMCKLYPYSNSADGLRDVQYWS